MSSFIKISQCSGINY